MKTWWFGKL